MWSSNPFLIVLVKRLTRNNGRKDADMNVYSAQGGRDTPFAGIAIEVGESDHISKVCRDTTHWLDSSDCQVFVFQTYTLIFPGEDRNFM